jgi:hypothetical protein
MTMIRTKWHRLKPLVDEGVVYWTAMPGEKCMPWDDLSTMTMAKLYDMVATLGALPKFVIDPELINMMKDDDYQRSLLDMKTADVLRLPFPACIVEVEGESGTHAFVLLRDLQAEGLLPFEDRSILALKQEAVFYAVVWLLHKDEDGEYLVFSPSVLNLDVAAAADPNDGMNLKVSGFASPFTKQDDKAWELCQATARKDAGWAYRALFAALLLLNTKGIKKEVIECERLNRKRTASGKPPIPRHTYITIGRVYRSAGGEAADDYLPRKSPRPHWRRGHLRHIRIGKGRTATKPVFIEGRLVSLASDTAIEAPTYMVKA